MKFFLNYTKKAPSKGFTLIETLVAISILLLATLGPLSVASKGLTTALFARDQVTAFYLAEEAIEYLKNVRDSNALQGYAWDADIANCVTTFGCTIDATSISSPSSVIVPCAKRCPVLRKDSSGRFNYSSGNSTQFTRKVVVENTSNADEKRIIVTMSWNTAGQAKSFSIQENLFNVY